MPSPRLFVVRITVAAQALKGRKPAVPRTQVPSGWQSSAESPHPRGAALVQLGPGRQQLPRNRGSMHLPPGLASTAAGPKTCASPTNAHDRGHPGRRWWSGRQRRLPRTGPRYGYGDQRSCPPAYRPGGAARSVRGSRGRRLSGDRPGRPGRRDRAQGTVVSGGTALRLGRPTGARRLPAAPPRRQRRLRPFGRTAELEAFPAPAAGAAVAD